MTPDSPVDLPEILTRPLEGNAELRVTVKQELTQRMEHFQSSESGDTAKLGWRHRRELDRQSYSVVGTVKFARLGRRHRRSLIAFVVLLLVWLGAVAAEAPEAVLLPFQSPLLEGYSRSTIQSLRGAQGDFLLPWQVGKTAWFVETPHWRENPDNPASYLGWISSQVITESSPPADYDAVWQRIDPGNAVWQLTKARYLGKKAFGRSVKGRRPLLHPEAFDQALDCLEQASRLDHLDEFRKERAAMVRNSLRAPRSFFEADIESNYVYFGSQSAGSGVASSVINPVLEKLVSRGDVDVLRRVVAADQRCQLLYALSDAPFYFMAQAHQDAVLKILGPAGPSGMDEEGTARLEKLRELMRDEVARRTAIEQGSGVSVLTSAKRDSPLNHAWVLVCVRLAAVAMAGLVLLVAALLWLRLLPRTTAGSATARCLEPLFFSRRRLFLAGLLLPGLWLAGCLAGMKLDRDALFLQAMGMAVYAFIALLVALVYAGRRDLERYVGFLGYGGATGRRNVVNTAILVVLLPAPLLFFSPVAGGDLWEDACIACACVAGLGFLWLVVKAAIGFFARAGSVRHRLLARWLIPVCLVWAGALLCLTGVLHGLERHTFAVAQDRWWIDPGEPEADPKLEPALRKLLEEWK